ncbi:MAG: Mycothiol acetyltransferase [Holosporales bacterium]
MNTVFFTSDDAPLDVLANIHASCFYEPWDADTFEAFLTTFGTKGIYLQSTDRIVGFIFFRQAFNDAEILTFCILPEYQNKGLGKQLIHAMFHVLEKPSKCFLEVSKMNASAIHAYTQCGFEIVHTRTNYYGPNLDAYMMMVTLEC